MTQLTRDSETVDLDSLLRALAAGERDVHVPDRVHRTVMQTWDATMTPVRPRQVKRYAWYVAYAAGAMAVVALMVAAAMYRGSSETIDAGVAPIAAAGPPALPQLTPLDLDEGLRSKSKRAPRAASSSKPPRAGARPASHAGILLVADPAPDGAGVSVVHVRVPRSTLVALGFSLTDPSAGGSVDLEVLLGEDGVARTIRRVVPVTVSDPQE